MANSLCPGQEEHTMRETVQNGNSGLDLRSPCSESRRTFRAMTKPVEACCSSPAAICYWFMVSLVAWGMLSLIGIFWRPLHGSPAACLFAMAIGCFANWIRNRSFHCIITGPLFLIAGIVFLLAGERMIHVNNVWIWPFILIGIGVAFVLEWRYAKRSAP
jgi:hypothetical protein